MVALEVCFPFTKNHREIIKKTLKNPKAKAIGNIELVLPADCRIFLLESIGLVFISSQGLYSTMKLAYSPSGIG